MKFAKVLLVIMGWTTAMASIILQSLYEKPMLSALDLSLLFIVSILGGAVLYDVKRVVFGFAFSMALTSILIFIVLSLPLLLGLVRHTELSAILYAGNITMMFRAMFPTVFVLCFVGAVIGGALGEILVRR